MTLHSAGFYLKQAVKILSELKSADLNLRDSFHYTNEYIENLSKAIITNNLLLSKIKQLNNRNKLSFQSI
jgi:hypothetical protein